MSGADGGELWVRAQRWVADRLGDERVAFLTALALDLTLELDRLGRVRFCHGARSSDEIVITRLTPDERLRGLLARIDERLVVCGRTHVQFDRSLDDTRVVNAGSVGPPNEAEPVAYWALLGDDVELRRTDYDIAAAAAAIAATGYPRAAEVTPAREVRAGPERRGG